jgi:hypothetical protein
MIPSRDSSTRFFLSWLGVGRESAELTFFSGNLLPIGGMKDMKERTLATQRQA